MSPPILPPTRRCAVGQPLHADRMEPVFNPLSPEFIRDPYPHYHRLRTADPMHRSPLGFFVASRHDDVSSILRDKRFGKDFVGRMTRRQGKEILEEPVYRSMRHWMLQQDPPDHTRLRGLVVKAFTARRVEDMRPRIQEIVDATVDRAAPQGHMDLIAGIAFPPSFGGCGRTPPWCPTPSRNSCATIPRCSSRAAWRWRMSRSAQPRCRRARASYACWAPPTATPPSIPIPTASTSPAPTS